MINNYFAYIWEYIVKKDQRTEFKKNYGPEGTWVQLFRKAEVYLSTDLHQDSSNPNRFITVDFWKSRKDRDQFRNQFADEFNALDEICENYTDKERLLGDFDCSSSRF